MTPQPPFRPVTNADRMRLIFVSIGIFLLFSLLVVKFYRIQIVEGEKWAQEAKKQHFLIVKEPFHRGVFFSNTSVKKGHPENTQSFVVDVQKFHLYVDPESIPTRFRKAIANQLISILDIPQLEQHNFRSQFYKKSRSRKLAMWLDDDTRGKILEWWNPIAFRQKIPRNALFFVNDYQRSYPFGKMLGQVLHTIQCNKDEKTNQAVPTGGLELYFNSYLKGKQGKRRLMRSPRNSFETGEVIALPQHGADIHLTINHCLQAIAEEEIAKGVKKSKAKAGWAVMMDPYTGEILALAQYPFFDPTDYQSYFNNPQLVENTRIMALSDANEPGSVMKPITIAIALKANEVLRERGEKPVFSPTEKTASSNGHFKGRSKPISDTHVHYFLNMDMALQKSANIYMSRLVESVITRLGKDWYRASLQDCFGLGKKTNIELPAESSGVLPLPGKKHPNGTLEWSASTPHSMAFGHNVQVTSMQLVRAYGVFANGGYLVNPTIVRKMIKNYPDGSREVLLDNTKLERRNSFPRVLSPEIVQAVVRAMKYVTKPGGTASRANIWGYTEAGKTGTSNKIVNGSYSPTLYWPTFVGFAPLNHPAFVLLVTMDEPEYGYQVGVGKKHHGGTCTAPVFRDIATRALEYLGIPPDDPHGYPSGDPRHDPEKADWLPEVQRLQALYESWNHKPAKK